MNRNDEIADFLTLLGLNGTETYKKAKSNYRALISKNHPDKLGNIEGEPKAQAELKSQQINRAWTAVEPLFKSYKSTASLRTGTGTDRGSNNKTEARKLDAIMLWKA